MLARARSPGIAVIAILLISCSAGDEPVEFEGDEAGECSDSPDNDRDGLFDCEDDGCVGSPSCRASDADADGDTDADLDNDTDVDSDGDADSDNDTEGEAGADTGVDADTELDAESDVDAYEDADVEIDAGRDMDEPVDADADGELDGDADRVGDADGDSTEALDGDLECRRDCSDHPLRSLCEFGDCTTSGEDTECCVASEPICSAILTVGDLYEDLALEYRGFYDHDHTCDMDVLEAAGNTLGVFEVQTRGLTSIFGFIRLQLRLTLGEFELGTTYDLCGEDAMPGMQIVVNTNAGGGDDISSFYNTAGDAHGGSHCELPGQITVNELGVTTGDGYDFDLAGRLMTIDRSGDFAGGTLDVEVSTNGLVTAE